MRLQIKKKNISARHYYNKHPYFHEKFQRKINFQLKGNKFIPSTKEIIAPKCERKEQNKIKGFRHNIENKKKIFRKENIINFFRMKKLE